MQVEEDRIHNLIKINDEEESNSSDSEDYAAPIRLAVNIAS